MKCFSSWYERESGRLLRLRSARRLLSRAKFRQRSWWPRVRSAVPYSVIWGQSRAGPAVSPFTPLRKRIVQRNIPGDVIQAQLLKSRNWRGNRPNFFAIEHMLLFFSKPFNAVVQRRDGESMWSQGDLISKFNTLIIDCSIAYSTFYIGWYELNLSVNPLLKGGRRRMQTAYNFHTIIAVAAKHILPEHELSRERFFRLSV